MKKQELARRLARKTGITKGEAADQVDRAVNEILHKLRGGRGAHLPGLGKFRVDERGEIAFQKEPREKR